MFKYLTNLSFENIIVTLLILPFIFISLFISLWIVMFVIDALNPICGGTLYTSNLATCGSLSQDLQPSCVEKVNQRFCAE